MDKIINMSLDEYIASHQKAAKEVPKSAERLDNNGSSDESKFKAERCENKNNDCEDDIEKEDLAEVVNGSETKAMGIWRGPSASTSFLDLDYMNNDFDEMFNNPDLKPQRRGCVGDIGGIKRFDLRERIQRNGGANTPTMSNFEFQQTRPMNTNAIALRSDCVGPLIPSNTGTFFDCRQNPNRQNRWQYHNKRNRNRGNGVVGGGGGNWSNQRNAFGSNNGRIQRFNQHRNNQEIFNKNMKSLMCRQNRINNNYNMPYTSESGSVSDLTIECPSDYINLSSNSHTKKHSESNLHINDGGSSVTNGSLQVSSLTVASDESQRNNNNSSLKALLGINDNFKTEMMPMLASKFLDFLQNGPNQTVHKPMYDMKIQKEIHDIQKKPLMYKCPGGEVVSSDGAGINNCEIIPRSSGVTLNYRFG